ncbi:MAG TPA: GNAT family N-acetyltransferase [Firmicutes bacterium]|nr:GNAT family N-acetyltransferase [Bacillota bacterium]
MIRDARGADYPAIVNLNAEAVEFTSAMDLERLKYLAALAAYHRVVETNARVVAFLLAMKDGAGYENDNFNWFSSRYERFLYVDRIVVDKRYHGRGIGTMLYKNLFVFAHQQEIPLVTCEINAVPPNKASARFHGGLGFREVGSQWICDGAKKVSMQAILL